MTDEDIESFVDIPEENLIVSDSIEINKPDENLDDLREVNIDGDALDSINLSLSEDDYYVIYKTINQEIKLNAMESLKDIFDSKGIDFSDVDLEDLLYDSESDEDDSESDEDFEDNYKSLIE